MLPSSDARRTLPAVLTALGIAIFLPATAALGQTSPVPFHGLPVTLLGNATAGENLPPPFLDVDDITSSLDDGIRLAVGSTQSSIGPLRWMAPESLAGRRYRVVSEGSDGVGTLWWAMDAVDLGGPVAFTLDPGNLAVAGSPVRLTLTDQGNAVYVGEQTNTLDPLFTSSTPPVGVTEGLGEIDVTFDLPSIEPLTPPILDDRNYEFAPGTQITITGVGTFTVDGVRISHRLRHRDRLVLHHVDVLFAEPVGLIGSRTVQDVALGVFGATHRGRGDMTLQATESGGQQRLFLDNIGSSGQDGVAVQVGLGEFGQTFVLDPTSLPAPQLGESLALALEGSWDGGPVVTVAKSTCLRADSVFDITHDARSSGAPLEVAFYLDDILVGLASDPSAPLQVTAGSWPSGGGITAEDDWGQPTAIWEWETAALVSSGTESPVAADEIRILLPSLSGGIDWEGDVILAPSMAGSTPLAILGRRNALQPPDPILPWTAMRSVGQAHVLLRDVVARVGNIGSSGEDGVVVEFPGSEGLSTDWNSPWMGAGTMGQRLEAAVHGPLEGQPDRPIIVGRVYNESDGVTVQLGADLSNLGATNLTYRLYDGAVMVAAIEAVNDAPALSLPVPPTGFAAVLRHPPDPIVPTLWITLVPDTGVTAIGGGPLKRTIAADLIEVLIDDAAPSAVIELSALSLRASDLEWIAVGNLGRNEPVTGASWASSPSGARLRPNVPNPFNPSTTITFELAMDGAASLRIYDLRGHLVKVLHEGPLSAGFHHRTWNGRDRRGHAVASGAYLVELKTKDASEVRKIALVR